MTEQELMIQLATDNGVTYIGYNDSKTVTLSSDYIQRTEQFIKIDGDTAKQIVFIVFIYKSGTVNETAYYLPIQIENNIDNAQGNELSAKVFKNETIRDKLSGAILKIAQQIFFEDPTTINHNIRLQIARRVMIEIYRYIDIFMFFTATDLTVQTDKENVDDTIIENIVSSHWEYLDSIINV